MDAELGVELAKCLDEFVSTSPLFNSQETDVIFLLTALLKGYGREQIKIDINEYGRIIVVSGEKPFQDTVMVGWKVYKKEMKTRGFTKAFKIPDNVILDQINARFNQDNFKLTVSMPKTMKGVKGIGFKEVKEEEIGIGNYISLPLDNDGDLPVGPQQVKDEIKNQVQQEGDASEERLVTNEPSTETEKKFCDQSTQTDAPRKVNKCCTPMIGGSALILSLIVFVIHFIRDQDKQKKKKSAIRQT